MKKITAGWIIIVLALFVFAIVLGILMRLNQAEVITQSPVTFYGNMTTHGLTMIAIWFVAGMAAIHYIMQRYVETSFKANLFAMIFTIIGVVMLLTSTLIGDFHAGWTFLYPLPFKVMWAKWATPLFLASLGVLAIGWLVWSLSMVTSMLKKYSIREVFAWQHLSRKTPEKATPPFILISMITLVGIVACLLAAVVLLVLLFGEFFSTGSIVNDALLMKNLTYFFGHTIANEMLYLGLAVIYELFGVISGQGKWKTTWYVALAWNFTLFFVLTAYFHHLFMDFVQPEIFQIIGQLSSYLASIPAAAVTIFSVIVAVYKKPVKWSIPLLLFFTGVAGWVIGGLGAVIDATISNNFVLHNTLWVPAHFHSYNAMGNVLFSMGFFSWFVAEISGKPGNKKLSTTMMGLLIIGGIVFLAVFYIGGADSIPRRFSSYPVEFTTGATLAYVGAIAAMVYLVAILLFLSNIGKRCIRIIFHSS